MREYLCELGHVVWRDQGRPTCGEGACRAPANWTGLRRGFMLDSQDRWDEVWSRVVLVGEDGHGCWLWQGRLSGHGVPWWRKGSLRREMWDWWWRGTWEFRSRKWVCGQERCIRPSHSEARTTQFYREVRAAEREAAGGVAGSSHTS